MRITITSHLPVSADGPGPQLPTVSGRGVINEPQPPAFPLAIVAGQGPDVQCDPSIEPQLLHPWLHGPHQGLSLIPVQTLTRDPQPRTFNTVQDSDQVTAADITDIHTPRHTGGQGGQEVSWDWGQVITEHYPLHTAEQSVVSKAGSADDHRQITETPCEHSFNFICQTHKHILREDTSGF